MAFGIDDDIAALVVAEETLGTGPTAATADVPEAFRRAIREEIRALIEGVDDAIVQVPTEFLGPEL